MNSPVGTPESSNLAEQLQRTAELIAEAAAQLIRKRRTELGVDGLAQSVATKSSEVDPVTVVDQESEALIRKLIHNFRPNDAVLGEEGGLHGPSSSEGAPHSADNVIWIVDPIDGTVNFLYGLPAFAVSIACEVNGEILAGAVVDVPGRRTYSARKNGGARVSLDDGRVHLLRASTPKSLSTSLIATGFGYDARRRHTQGQLVANLLPKCRDIRRIGSAAIDLCLVAAGSLDGYYEHGLGVWDYSAGALIAREAGAVVKLPAKGATSRNGAGVFAVAPSISDEFFNALQEVGATDTLPQ